MVFAYNDDLVMKIPKNSFGLYQNRIENYIYESAEDRLKKYLCPIIKFEPELLLAKRAIPINDDKEYLSSLMIFCGSVSFYQDILDLCQKYYLCKEDIRATSSWGILDGNKVLMDYGCPNKQGYRYYKKILSEIVN